MNIEVACVQLGPPQGESLAERLEQASAPAFGLSGVDLIVLPELWPTGYFAFDRYRDDAEPLAGAVTRRAAELARATGAHVVAGTFVEAGPDGQLHNTAAIVDPSGELVASYRKMHVFSHRSREPELIAPGAEPVVAETALGRLGLAICYDLRFPELFRLLADRGAELIVIPSAWPAARAGHWRLLARARALENLAFVVGCNAAGEDHGTALAGHSVVIDPWGEPVAEAGTEPTVLRARIDPAAVAAARRDFPALRDRRIGVPDTVGVGD
jgi:predicted amidohydrolase